MQYICAKSDVNKSRYNQTAVYRKGRRVKLNNAVKEGDKKKYVQKNFGP